MQLTDENGFGLKVYAESPLSCNALPYSDKEIQDADYSWQLPSPERIHFNVDYAQLGVGGDNSWGAICLPPYRLEEKAYQYSYYVEVLK